MKIKAPSGRKKRPIPAAWQKWAILFGVTLSFLGGMIFYRSGIPSLISAGLRRIPAAEPVVQAVSEIQQDVNTEAKLYQSNGLANIFLDIPFDSMLALEAKRAEALETGVLFSTDDDYVPARLRYNDEQNLDIKLRLKGDWVDHLEGDKWSFRVHITEADGALLGMRRFSLQGPQTRSYVSEWVYHQNLFLEGILATRYHFVNVIVNGEHKGIYALEESFTEDLLESQARREGIIFRMDENLLWHDWASFLDDRTGLGRFWLVEYPELNEVSPFRESRIAGSETLSAELRAAEELLFSLNQGLLSADQVLDEDLWGRYFAITDLWGGGHGTRWHNDRYYFNPVTSLIEPIAFDGFVFHPSFERDKLAYPFYDQPFFQSPGVQRAYIETLERILTPEYQTMLQAQFESETAQLYSLLLEEFPEATQESEIAPHLMLPWDALTARADSLARNLSPLQPLRVNYHWVESSGQLAVQLDLLNMMAVPVQINAVQFDEKIVQLDPNWCFSPNCAASTFQTDASTVLLSAQQTEMMPVSFRIPIEALNGDLTAAGQQIIQAQLYGGSQLYEIPIYANHQPTGIETGIKPTATLAAALAAHPYLTQIDETQLAIEPGDWQVTTDLILPAGYDLLILEGTTLRFSPDGLFFVNGSLDMLGAPDAPVILTAQAQNWGGMVVLNASRTSTWRYVKVEKMAGVTVPGWVLTGGITFYESPVEISNSLIGSNTTEDALNVIRTSFYFDRVEFSFSASDAFDGDFTTGTVSNSSFHDIVGDGFDVSGSDITIVDSTFLRIGDKAVSIGEKSQAVLHNLTLTDVNIGIASKDLSQVYVENTRMTGVKYAGLAAYIKKPQYGPASIEAQNVKIESAEFTALCQTGNTITLNGETISTQDFDVDALYSQKILGN